MYVERILTTKVVLVSVAFSVHLSKCKACAQHFMRKGAHIAQACCWHLLSYLTSSGQRHQREQSVLRGGLWSEKINTAYLQEALLSQSVLWLGMWVYGLDHNIL